MKVVVQKFGGTCVDSEPNQLITAERIMEARDRGLHPIVVVSAMGRAGQPYSTVEMVNLVRRIDPDIEARELDLLMSCGEIISTVAMAHLLKAKGYETIAFSGGQAGLITDDYYGHARIVDIRPDGILAALQDGYLVFVAGFQGNTTSHQITTLGAGGSDYTAVALTRVIKDTPRLPFGEMLEVEPLQIYKEVPGVMTANPKTLADTGGGEARALTQLTYDECVALSRLGAEVLQQQAAEMAREHGIPLLVRDYRVSDSSGTEVGAATTAAGPERATAIADQEKLLVLDLQTDDSRFVLQIAERLDRERLTYFQVNTPDEKVRLAVRPFKYRNVSAIVDGVLQSRHASAEINEGDFALVSVVGERLRGRLEEWREKAERVLTGNNIAVHGTSQGAISLSHLVPEADRKKAVALLHEHTVL